MPVTIRITILWLVIAFAFVMHGYYHLAELFFGVDIKIEGATGKVPINAHLFSTVVEIIPLVLGIWFLFRVRKGLLWFSYIFALILCMLNLVHWVSTVMHEPGEIRQAVLLALIVVVNILLCKELLKEIKSRQAVAATNTGSKKKRWTWAKHQKRWFGKWHLYLGVIAGAVLCITGLTGSILVFQDEIDRALNKDLFIAVEGQKRYEIEEIIPLVREKYPDKKFSYVLVSDANNPNSTYRFYNTETEVDKAGEFFVNPYTGEISGKRLFTSGFIRVVTNIHRTMLVPVAGRYIVGLCTLCMLILTISGLKLWVPQQYKKWKQWKSVLTVNFRAGFKRQNYDWHNVLGFYSAPVVIMLALSGFAITFSTVFIAFLFVFTGKSPQSVAGIFGKQSSYVEGAKELTVGEVAAIAQKTFPNAEILALAPPLTPQNVYRFDMKSDGVAHTGNRIMVMVDQYSGEVLLNSEKDFPNVGNSYLSWLTPIHYGTFGGMPTRILALIGGLIPLLLYITGFIIWWPRYKRQKLKPERSVRSTKEDEALAAIRQLPLGSYSKFYFRKGLKYALMLLAAAFLCGLLYGLISGIVIQPALFAVLYTGISIVVNFIIALVVTIITLVVFAPFGLGKNAAKYLSLSLAFLLVFLPVCIAIALGSKSIF